MFATSPKIKDLTNKKADLYVGKKSLGYLNF